MISDAGGNMGPGKKDQGSFFERTAMPDNAEMMKQMDEAAALAEAEFYKNCNDWKAEDVVVWWSKWYLKAGHKRLGRVLVAKGRKPKT